MISMTGNVTVPNLGGSGISFLFLGREWSIALPLSCWQASFFPSWSGFGSTCTKLIKGAQVSGRISSFEHQLMEMNLTAFHDVVGGCERILKTPTCKCPS